MDTSLHCNDLSCRSVCPGQAVVTTCSHIFCLPCAQRLGLSEPKDGQRQCPACATHLDNLDDAVVTSLNPTEDYKTSILSGFSPAVIMECASRGLSFWSYQMAQEITYQAYLARSLTEKYSGLSTHLDNTVREANSENQKLNHKIDTLSADVAHLIETNQRLNDEVRKKTKLATHHHTMYNKLKEQQISLDIGAAAGQDADNVLQGAAQRPQIHRPADVPPRRGNSHGSSGSGEQHRRMTLPYAPGNSQAYRNQSSHAGVETSQGFLHATPNRGNRQHLPNPTYGQYATGVTEGFGGRNDMLRQGTPLLNTYGHANPTGYRPAANAGNNFGLSSNVKVGRQQQTAPQRRMAGGYSTLNIR
ncbi:uncharacterized protein RCC_10756 [Ramularia collo-cygni]|uniref:RING-type domain-containing protein n=1 Tax=Ramularia collo-cygni TaxID=112498 RepID=A0A2D3VRK9_9PEZI|nr:uncharacterized protein RCC_10756 [Ramularia collo-cygni]CZT25028.1 uncharacterized protein RCC_10756 [Ramularia collo-cygni]